MKIWVLVLSLLLALSASAENQCVDLFDIHQTAEDSVSQVAGVMMRLTTDRYLVYRLKGGETVLEYLNSLRDIQNDQVDTILRIRYPTLKANVIGHYRGLLNAALEFNRRDYDFLTERYSLATIPIETLVEPLPVLEDLARDVMTMTIRTNPILAEFLATVRFPDVVMTETPMQTVVERTVRHITPEMRRLLDSCGNRQLDFISRENGSLVWGEVKYLGRYKMYSDAAGEDVSQKMIDIKKLALLMGEPVRVVLVITGPGHLKPEAEAVYTLNGIEVLYLTPHWN